MRTSVLRSSRGLVGLLLVAALAGAAQAQLVKMYRLVELNSSDGTPSRAYAVNDTGHVVGLVGRGNAVHSAHWVGRVVTDLHGMVHFELLHPYPMFDQNYSIAYGVSNAGQVVGTARVQKKCGDDILLLTQAYVVRAAVQTDIATPFPGDALTNLRSFGDPCPGSPNGPAPDSVATNISNNNHIVGWADRADGVIHAFLVAPRNGQFYVDVLPPVGPSGNPGDGVNDLMIDLGTLAPDADPVSSATAVNVFGQVTGWSYTRTPGGQAAYHAFLVTPQDTNSDGEPDLWFIDGGGYNTLMLDLGTLGGPNSWGRAINSLGHVVGESDYTNSAGEHYTRAFLWQSGSMRDLGTLRSNPTKGFSAASGINDQGVVVGWAENDNFERRAFIYEGGQMKDLNNLIYVIGENGEVQLPRITLTEARDINEDGVIVGWGTVGSASAETRAFLLNPILVDPATLVDNDGDGTPDGANGPTGGTSGGFTGQVITGTPGNLVVRPDSSGGTPSPAPIGLCGAGSLTALPLILAGLAGMRWRRR